jgi:Ca2+-binding RTX toxin-like protein
MFAGAGNDLIDAGSGNDTIIGGFGTDTITGGGGADLFVYGARIDGFDIITDFTPFAGTSQDLLSFSTGVFSNFAAVQAAMRQVGNDTFIGIDAFNGIVLRNVSMSNLTSDDFTFF